GTLNVLADPDPHVPNSTTIGTLRAGDFNGDGTADVVGVQMGSVGVTPEPPAWVQLGDGTGALGQADDLAYPQTLGCCGAVGDFNNDGRSDIALVDELSAYFLTSQGGGQFSPFTVTLNQDTSALKSNFYANAIALGDFNDDGNIDAAVVGVDLEDGAIPASETLQIILGNGDGTFALAQSVPLPTFNFNDFPNPLAVSLLTPAVADLNGDGNLDLILPDVGQVQIFYGNGDGTFQPAVTMPAPTSNFTIASVADFNLDGIPDLMLSDYGQVSILYGKGGGKFTAPVNYAAGDWPSRAVITDLNGDGAPDLVFGSGTDAVVMLNIPPPGSLPIIGQLTVQPEPSAYHQPFTIIATIKPAKVKEGTPTGSVTFSVDGQVVGASPLTGDTASIVDSQFLAAGTHSVTAVYSGDAVFHSYAMSAQHVVLGTADTITLTGQPNPASLTQNVTFTAQVSGAGGVPTGTVQFLFLDGSTPEGIATLSNGSASITENFCSTSVSGPHALQAHYLGDGTFGANTSAVFTENIIPGPGDFQMTVAPTSTSVQLGQSATMKVTLTSMCGFNGPVNLTCTGAAVAGTTCTFNVNPVTIAPSTYPQLSQVTITTSLPTTASSAKFGSLSTGALLAGALLFLWPRRLRRRGIWVVLLAMALLAGPGCTKGYVDLGTSLGKITLNITGTAANNPTVTHSVPVTITVQ
ncbi:MAG: FG-GAP-like repeat-containing protein, partial [Terracidiphilus sp.]